MSGRRISVRSLGYYMLKKLWLILLCMLALGFLLVGYKYLKDKKNQEDAENQEDTSVNLSATDLNDAKNAVIQYRYAKQMEKYLKESPLMKVDASKEKQTVVEYRIKLTGVDEVTSTGTLENSYLQLLRAYINDSVFVGDLQALNAEYSEHAYIKELVWCNNTNGGEYTVGVIETDAFPTLAKDLRTVVEAYMDQLMKEDVRLKITPVKENTVVVYDSSTDTNQKAAYSSLISFRKNYSTAYTNFSAAPDVLEATNSASHVIIKSTELADAYGPILEELACIPCGLQRQSGTQKSGYCLRGRKEASLSGYAGEEGTEVLSV